MAQLMPLLLTVSCFTVKARLVSPFWYRLTWVVLVKGPLNGCVCVCACVRACVRACVCVRVCVHLFIRPRHIRRGLLLQIYRDPVLILLTLTFFFGGGGFPPPFLPLFTFRPS